MEARAVFGEIEKIVGFYERGIFTAEEVCGIACDVVTPENVVEIVDLLPEATVPLFKSIVKERVLDREHLLPERSPFSRFSRHSEAPANAAGGFGNLTKSTACMVCLPSFEESWSVCVCQRAITDWSIILRSWPLHTRVDQLEVREVEAPFDVNLAIAVCRVWASILKMTRHPGGEAIGRDGVEFHFLYFGECSEMAGRAWSPAPDTAPGHLATLGCELRSFVEAAQAISNPSTESIRHELNWFENGSRRRSTV